MSIDLKAHGLRVKPLEWMEHSARWLNERYVVFHDKGWHAFRLHNSIDDIAHATAAEAKTACQAHHESQVLALLESIEGGQ